MFTKHWKQLQGISKPLLLTYLPAIVMLLVVFLQPRDTWRILLQDPAAYFDLPFYSGLVSHLGVFLWVVSGVVAIFSSCAGQQLGRDLQRVRLLRNMGLFSLVLGIDDMFLLHELALPSVGIPEIVVLGSYGLTLAALM